MAHQVVWLKLSVTDQTDPDKPVEHILPRGAAVPDFVDPFTLFALTGSGAIRAVTDLDPALLAELNPQQPVLMPEHAPGIGDFDDPGYGLERTSVGGLAASPGAEVVDHTTAEGRAEEARAMGDKATARRVETEAPRTRTRRWPGPARRHGSGGRVARLRRFEGAHRRRAAQDS
jgi:hypothetical protein